MNTLSVVTMLAAIHQHMSAFTLPEPCTITVDPNPSSLRRHVGVQLSADRDLPVLASQLLSWADTLTEITVSAWRTVDGDAVHLDLNGVLADGQTTVQAWGGIPYSSRFELGRGESQSVPFGSLRDWSASEVAA
jgi:hypothetical protein